MVRRQQDAVQFVRKAGKHRGERPARVAESIGFGQQVAGRLEFAEIDSRFDSMEPDLLCGQILPEAPGFRLPTLSFLKDGLIISAVDGVSAGRGQNIRDHQWQSHGVIEDTRGEMAVEPVCSEHIAPAFKPQPEVLPGCDSLHGVL